MKPYPRVDDLVASALRVRMPRAPRVITPGGTMHVVARRNNREFYFTTADDFDVLFAHLPERIRTYAITMYAYTLMSNHVHLLLQAPTHQALGRPLRWFLTETARAFHEARGRRGHFRGRHYRSCAVGEDTYAVAAFRYLDPNAVRAGVVKDPPTGPWSICAAYALGALGADYTVRTPGCLWGNPAPLGVPGTRR